MADKTKIEWADATVPAINGCSVHTPGCTNCYAMKQAHRVDIRRGLTKPSAGGMVWTGEVRLSEKHLMQPLHWIRPRRIFWNAHGDPFHASVPDEWIDRMFAVCALTPQHTHMILTKRSERMADYMPRAIGRIADRAIKIRRERGDTSVVVPLPHIEPGAAWFPVPNVMLGVSVEDQPRADERREHLKSAPAALKFVSYEPALGPVDWTGWEFVDQIISGGESGPKARPAHPDWFRATRDFCAANGVAFFHKQNGAWAAIYDRDADDPDWRQCGEIERKNPKGRWLNLAGGHGFHGERVHYVVPCDKKAAGRLLDGVEHNGFPEIAA